MSNTQNPVTALLADLASADASRRAADALERAHRSVAAAADKARFLAPRSEVLEALRDAEDHLDEALFAVTSPALSRSAAHLRGLLFAAGRLVSSSKLDLGTTAREAVADLLDEAALAAHVLESDAQDLVVPN